MLQKFCWFVFSIFQFLLYYSLFLSKTLYRIEHPTRRLRHMRRWLLKLQLLRPSATVGDTSLTRCRGWQVCICGVASTAHSHVTHRWSSADIW